MNNSNKQNIGEEIKNLVQGALQNGDFKSLSNDIERITKDLFKDFNFTYDKSKNKSIVKVNTPINKTQALKEKLRNEKLLMEKEKKEKFLTEKKPSYAVPVGKTSSILYTVFGSIGLGIFGITSLVLFILGNIAKIGGVFKFVNMGIFPLAALSGILLYNGGLIRKRLRRFQRYLNYMNQREYYLIKEIAGAMGQSEKATLKDLRRMISIGMFPEGRIDANEMYFILTNRSYEEYLKLQEGLKMQAIESENEAPSQLESNGYLSPEVEKTIKEGKDFVQEIKDANIAIPGEGISNKLDKLEEVTDKIFEYVAIHPEKLPEIRKFMDYFLPTTLKLLDAYQKLDKQPIQGKNIVNSKKEIEDTIDTINHAFENLLDDLFEDLAMDVSTDISVLKTIFAQEGLIDDKIRNKKLKGDE